jgi:dTDP-4-amino-4,6-dideoxygalactose transaminase
MGLTNLQSLDAFICANYRNYRKYQHVIGDVPGFSLTNYDESEKCNFQYIVAEVEAQVTGLHRDDLIKVLHAENVLARRYFWPGCHRMEPYHTLFPDAYRLLPQTEKIAERIMVLPTGTTIGEQEIDAIGDILRTAIAHAAEIRQRLTPNRGNWI